MMLFGAGQADLTPPEALPLGGYTERHGAVFAPGGDTLWARARAVGDVMLVSVEMLTIPESLVAAVRAKTGEQKLFMAATHTHCAPDSQMLNDRMTLLIPGIAPFRRRWLEWYADRIALAITSARKNQNREIVSFELRQTPVPLARSRRKWGAPDNMATEVEVKLAGGASETLFTVFGAHPTLYSEKELQCRGDWPGALMNRTGGLAFAGAIGDASPVPPLPPSAGAEAQVSTFADILRKSLVAATGRTIAPVGLQFVWTSMILSPPWPHPEFAKANGISDSMAQNLVTKFAPPSAVLTGIKFGDLLLVGVPGEPTGELARQMEAEGRKQGYRVAVCSHVNGWIGYILSPADYARGGYEAQLSMHGSETGLRLEEACYRLLQKLNPR